jgi:hypothetical protein
VVRTREVGTGLTAFTLKERKRKRIGYFKSQKNIEGETYVEVERLALLFSIHEVPV